MHHNEFTHVCWGICIRYLWSGLKKTCFFPGRYQLANFSHMALSCLHKITQTSRTFFLRKQQQNSSSASFPKFPHHNNKIRLFLFLLYFILFSLFLSLCLSISSGTPLLHVNHIQKDGRSARQQWKRKERKEREREREERVRNKTTKLADVESRKVASFGRAGNDRKTSKNGRTEDENSSQMDGQNATRKTKWTNST